MKYLVLISLLGLVGCGSGYEINRKSLSGNCIQNEPTTILYRCEHVSTWIFENNITLAICETEKECREICDKARNKD